MPKFIDLTRQRFERLVVKKQAGKNKHGQFMWLCLCDCGNKVIVVGNDLRRGHTKSCGRLITKHGCRNNEIYPVWREMIRRCTNPNHKQWKDYGGRGITVYKEWMDSPENFIKDMGERPEGCTLERRKNWKGYYSKNCYWATWEQQNRNKRNNRCVPYKGKNRLLVELCEEHNMPYNVVYKRIYILGWPLERALTEPIQRRKNNG